MTVEERAQTVITEIGRYSESSEIRALIESALRDQIEDCAKIADEQVYLLDCGEKSLIAELIASQIRALAAPTENNQEKGEMRDDS